MGLFRYCFCIYLIFFSCCDMQYRINGAVTISPSPKADVCRVGERLQVTCNTTKTTIEWELAEVVGHANTIKRILSANSTTNSDYFLISLNSTTLIFSRISEFGASPLMSMLVILSISQNLNGTRVKCIERGAGADQEAMTTIIIHEVELDRLKVIIEEQQFKPGSVAVHVHWAQPETLSSLVDNLVSYNVSIMPKTPGTTVSIINNTNANLTVPYNNLYRVSIVVGYCGKRISEMANLSYSKCGDPLEGLPTHAANSIQILGYVNPALQGHNVTVSCRSGLPLNGSNSATLTCLDSEQWEPDPRGIECDSESTISGFGSEPVTSTTLAENSVSTNMICSGLICTKSATGNLGIIAGSTVGLLVTAAIIILLFILLSIILVWKKKSTRQLNLKCLFMKSRKSETVEQTRSNCGGTVINQVPDQEKSLASQLVYADIGSSLKQQKIMLSMSNLNPDDHNRVEYAQLNYNPFKDKGEESNSIPGPGDNQLKSTCNPICIDLDNLLIQLRPQVGPKWYEFGEAAGIKKEILENYASHCNPEDCIVEMLDYWLRNHDGQPTWKEIAKFLREIGLGELAAEIDKVYLTGKLPIVIEVDSNVIPQLQAVVLNSEEPPPIPPKIFKIE